MTKGGKRPGAGRPKLPGSEKRVRRSLLLAPETDAALAALKRPGEGLGQVVDRLARGEATMWIQHPTYPLTLDAATNTYRHTTEKDLDTGEQWEIIVPAADLDAAVATAIATAATGVYGSHRATAEEAHASALEGGDWDRKTYWHYIGDDIPE